jgi:DNA topoisomerase-1
MKTDSATAAKLAGLILSDRHKPGISRVRIELPSTNDVKTPPFRWDYFQPSGDSLLDESRIKDLNALAVPPAWADVWFCTDKNGHIQATGKDGKGRLQYRYHPAWNETKADLKFSNVDEFALTLPRLRTRVDSDLALGGMPLEKATALVIKLIDEFHIRVGSDQYARENESYGLTTLQEGHVQFIRGINAEGDLDAVLDFVGKSGKRWRLVILDDDLARMIEDSGKLGGNDKEQDLFRYEDTSGRDFDLKAEHINQYISETLEGMHYTAKDFRTWAASWKLGARLAIVSQANAVELSQIPELMQAAISKVEGSQDQPVIVWMGTHFKRPEALVKLVAKGGLPGKSIKERQATIQAVIDTVAGDLGNTRAVCRSSYIRPMFMNDWESGLFEERWLNASKMKLIPGLNRDESTSLHYMRTHE